MTDSLSRKTTSLTATTAATETTMMMTTNMRTETTTAAAAAVATTVTTSTTTNTSMSTMTTSAFPFPVTGASATTNHTAAPASGSTCTPVFVSPVSSIGMHSSAGMGGSVPNPSLRSAAASATNAATAEVSINHTTTNTNTTSAAAASAPAAATTTTTTPAITAPATAASPLTHNNNISPHNNISSSSNHSASSNSGKQSALSAGLLSPAPLSSGLQQQLITTPVQQSDVSGMGLQASSVMSTPCSLSKTESYKDRKRTYQKAKKKVADELLMTISDPTVVVAQDWLKIRGSLKGWTKVWCELKPGLILLYKSPKTHKTGVWIGTILLNVCEVIERPSKKNGFCFKLFHPLEQSIWASKGPKGEIFGALIQPLPTYFLIFRATSEASGKQWMEAIELSFRCSSLLVRNTVATGNSKEFPSFILTRASAEASDGMFGSDGSPPPSATLKLNEHEIEKHFVDHDLDDEEYHSEREEDEILNQLNREADDHSSDSDSDVTSLQSESLDCVRDPGSVVPYRRTLSKRRSLSTASDDELVVQTQYIPSPENEEFGTVGDQTEEVGEENKSLLWTLLKQVRPGMDLSKVVLPTFILEPRSFLEKLSDYYYHSDILSTAGLEEDPFVRMKLVTKWYMSGFYKKPRGLKKPYNPILGETFRCCWLNPTSGARTFYIAEQISHHPPISAFHVTNRKDGFCIHGSILAKSKFYGNSVSAVLDGTARLTLLTRGEDYTLTMPYAHCKGILMGTLSLELGGKVEIRCDKTGYTTEIEFKLKPFLGGNDYCNLIVGKIKLGKETLATLEGHWDTEIRIRDKKSGHEDSLWKADQDARSRRLKRLVVPIDSQGDWESEKLWINVTNAISRGDQVAATEEKTVLEEQQRRGAQERKVSGEDWIPHYFVPDMMTGEWVYKHVDARPWDMRTDVIQYEKDYVIQTKTRHRTPVVAARANSVVSIEASKALSAGSASGKAAASAAGASGGGVRHHRMRSIASARGSGESSPETTSRGKGSEAGSAGVSRDGSSRKKKSSSSSSSLPPGGTHHQHGRKGSNPLESSEDNMDTVIIHNLEKASRQLAPSSNTSAAARSSSSSTTAAAAASGNRQTSSSSTSSSFLKELKSIVREIQRQNSTSSQAVKSSIDTLKSNQQEILNLLKSIHAGATTSSSPGTGISRGAVFAGRQQQHHQPDPLIRRTLTTDSVYIVVIAILIGIIYFSK